MTTPPRTSDATLENLTLRSPDALVAAVPYLLGFAPRESAVIVWLRRGRILLTQRLDLPAAARDHAPWVRIAWSHQAVHRADELVLILVAAHPVDPALIDAFLRRCDRSACAVRDVLRVDDGRWWSLMCADADCCPAEGRAIDPGTASAVAAEFTVMGRAPLPDRDCVAAGLEPDPERVAQVADRVAQARTPRPSRRRPPRRSLEAARDEALADLAARTQRVGAVGPVDAPAAVRLLAALADIRVRDTFLWDVAQLEPDRLHEVWDMLVDLLRSAPQGQVAPVATCCAVVAWLEGDGARALMAIERAHHDDPTYSLASLVAASVQAGLPPQAWREAMAALTRDQCRFGATSDAG